MRRAIVGIRNFGSDSVNRPKKMPCSGAVKAVAFGYVGNFYQRHMADARREIWLGPSAATYEI